MKLTETYLGQNDRFEGDQTLWLRSLPEGAKATRATVTLRPVAGPGGSRFRESIAFIGNEGELGADKNLGSNFIEIDFHVRRTLARAQGSGGTFTLQVDMGGALVGIAADGTFLAGRAAAWLVALPTIQDNLPSLTVSRFRLTCPAAAAGSFDLSEVQIYAVPSNLQARLGQMAPFWVRLGELAQPETSPDFAEVLNAFIATAEVKDGILQIPLVLHSDTLARLEVTLEIDYVIEQLVLPSHLSEVNIPFDFSTLPEADESLLMVRLPKIAVPVKGCTGAAIRGTFEPSRLAMGEAGEMPAAGVVIISPQCSLAQPVVADREISLSSIDLPLAKIKPGLAGLYLSLMSDADGKPSGDVLTEADVRVAKPLPDGRIWGSATLPEPYRVLTGARYWLVLQSRNGEAYWSVEEGNADQPTLQCSHDGGLSWRAAGGMGLSLPLAAQFRLRHLPERFQVPVQLQIGKGAGAVHRRLDEFSPAGRIEFGFDFADKLKEHLDHPDSLQSCRETPGLSNPDFALPAPDDATRLLFGFDTNDTNSYWNVSGSVDLSRGVNLSQRRFIVLSIGSAAPLKIDCSGADPAHTSIEEIVAAINREVGEKIAEGSSRLGQFLQLVSNDNLTLHNWCRRGLPQGWQGSGEKVHRFRRSSDEPGFAILLADPGLSAADLRVAWASGLVCLLEDDVPLSTDPGALLVQRFPVGTGCSYRLQFRYQVAASASLKSLKKACSPESLAPPRWEIAWLDETGSLLESVGANLKVRTPSLSPGLVEERLTPPEGATQAEWRLDHPSSHSYGLAIDEVRIAPVEEETANGDFSRWEGEFGKHTPVGWTVEAGWIEEGMAPGRRQGLRLLGDSSAPEDAVLVQTVVVETDKKYQMQVTARLSSPLSADAENLADQSRSRLELRWQTEDGPGEPMFLFLDDRGFSGRAWIGKAPAGASSIEIRLIHPRGESDLQLEAVRFRKIDMAEVPLTFLAEAPGELKVSDLRVTYDLPAPPKSVQTALQATLSAQPLPPEHFTSSLADQPAAIVAGVGRRYTAILVEQSVPIRTIGQLAAMDPAVEIEGIALERRLEIKAAAEMILDFAAECACFAASFREPMVALLTADSEVLSRRSGQPVEQVRQLQKKLRAQHLLLNNKALFGMTLEDLCARRLEAKKQEDE